MFNQFSSLLLLDTLTCRYSLSPEYFTRICGTLILMQNIAHF